MVDLRELSWDELLANDKLDWPLLDYDTVNEIICRCPDFATKNHLVSTNLIHLASHYGYIDIVKVLLTKKSELSYIWDAECKSPLEYAAMTGKMEVIDMLLQAMRGKLESGKMKSLVEDALHIAIAENQREAFRVLAYQYMEGWDSDKVASIKTTNKLLQTDVEHPRLSEAAQSSIQDFNKLLLLACKNYSYVSSIERINRGVHTRNLERLLNNDTLLFETVSSPRSCPLETQLYLTVFTAETDDLVQLIMKRKPELVEPDYFLLHSASEFGCIETVKLILSQVSCTSTACSRKDDREQTPLHCAVMLPGNELVIRKLLSTSWECVGAVGGRRNTVLYLAGQKSYINFKILLESHIVKDELLDNNNVNYWKGGKFVSETADRYIKIVKELLSQSDCKVCFVKYDKDDQNWNGCLAAVIKGKFTDNIFGDVQDVRATAEDGPLIHLSYRRKSITLKVLLRHPRIREIMAIDTPQCLLDSRNTNLMGKLSARMYKRYDQAILLMDAIQMGDVEDYNELLALYPDILDFVSLFPLGGTPLHIAIKAGQGKLTELIKDIIRRRPDFAHYPNRNGFPPLHIASARGYLDIVKELLAQVGHHLCYLNRYASSPSLDDDFDDNQEHVERKKENFDKFLDWDIEYNDEEESLDRNSWARTPLHYAIANERVSVINELLPIWWKSRTGMVMKERDTSLLRSVSIPEEEEEEEEEEDSEALKMLMSRYIEDELLNSEDYWNTDAASELGSVYIQIMKHLLNPDISCHLSFFFVYKTEEEGRPTDARYNHCSSVIKVKCGIINGENDNLYKMLTTSYLKYFQEVTSTQGKSVLNLWADKEASIITMKIWMRSPLFYIEDFDRMWFSDAEVRHKHKLKDEVQSRVTIWNNGIHDNDTLENTNKESEEQVPADAENDHGETGEGAEAATRRQPLHDEFMHRLLEDHSNDGIEKLPENGEVEGVQNISEKGFCAESLSEILGDQAQLLEAEEDDNREVHEQELPDVYNTKLSLFTGQTFESARKCRQAIKNASIDDKREIKFLTSGSSKIKALCSDESCQWSLYAKIEKGGKSFIVGEIEGTHTCSRLGTSDKIKLATPQWISDCIVDHIWPDKNAFLKLNDMRVVSFIKREYQIDIEATPASKGKKKAIETIHDLQLQDYTARILQSNPDSKIAFLATKKDKLGKDKEFQGVVISYKACWNGFLNGCAPLVFFEKIPMEKEGNNLLLAAIGVDGNNCMFPFAFALVGKKTVLKDDWEFFFEQLDFILKHPGYKQMAIISNLSYEITKIIENKFPGAEQGPCAWHLALEMQSKFGSDIELYFRPISMAETREEYNEAFEDLKSRNEEAAEWLTENLPRNWVTSKFLPARILPVLATLEQISICSTRMFDERRATATTNSSSSLTDYADKLIKVSDEASKAHNVLPSKQSIYEVQDSNNNRKYEIDLLSKSCTCLCWQKMGIPCSHAIATLKKVQKDTPYSEYCEARYRIQCFGKAYEDTIKPVEVLHTPYEDIRPKKRRKSSDISEGNVGQ